MNMGTEIGVRMVNMGNSKEHSQHMKERTVDDIIEVASWGREGHSGLETTGLKAQRYYPGSAFTMQGDLVRHVSCFVPQCLDLFAVL